MIIDSCLLPSCSLSICSATVIFEFDPELEVNPVQFLFAVLPSTIFVL